MTDRITTANRVLAMFVDRDCQISRRTGGWHVSWTDLRNNGSTITRRWMTRGGQDFYPVWNRIYPGGGTSCTALSQLIRWCADKPVLPISTWRYWAGERVKLLGSEAVDILLAGGYPEHVNCVLCGNQIEGGLDWWSLNGVSGPCCGWTSGCRQKTKPEKVA